MPKPKRSREGVSSITGLEEGTGPVNANTAVENAFFASAYDNGQGTERTLFFLGNLDLTTLPDGAKALPFLAAATVVKSMEDQGILVDREMRISLLKTATIACMATVQVIEASDDPVKPIDPMCPPEILG